MSKDEALRHLRLAKEESVINQPVDNEVKARWLVWALCTRIDEGIRELEEVRESDGAGDSPGTSDE